MIIHNSRIKRNRGRLFFARSFATKINFILFQMSESYGGVRSRDLMIVQKLNWGVNRVITLTLYEIFLLITMLYAILIVEFRITCGICCLVFSPLIYTL